MSVIEKLESYGLIPTVKMELTAEQAVEIAKALKKGGLEVMELSVQNQGVYENIAAIKAACSDMILGVGDVTSEEQVEAAEKAGAVFVTTTGGAGAVIASCKEKDICVIPGCATPADIAAAKALGLSVVKYFPTENLQTLADITAAFPDMKIVAQGGCINEENLEPYLHTKGVMAVSGGWMVKEAQVEAGDYAAIAKCARKSVLAIFQYIFEHVGINYCDVPSMEPTVFMLADMFDLKIGDTGSSTFVSEYMELTKEKYRGDFGHIGFRTNDIVRSVFYFKKAGFEFEEGSERYYKGGLHVIYFKERWGNFAWHLQTNNTHNPPRWEDAEVVLERGGLSNKYIGKVFKL